MPHGASKAEGGEATTETETAPITRITPKQLRRRLEKAVLAGEMDRDEARFAEPQYDAWWALWEEAGWISLGRTRNYDWMHVQACR